MKRPSLAGSGRGLRHVAWALLLVLTALYLSWRALAAMDFGYPLLYRPLGLEQNIQTYAPRNTIRPGFQLTSREERFRLFAGIGRAIRNDGQGLAGLRYHDTRGRELGTLLTAPEIVHLQDVAHLVARFERVGLLALFGWLGLCVWQRRRGWPLPTLPSLLLGTVAVLAAGGLLVAVVGPGALFYWLHEVIFPPDHPWFFYYQASLMSTMMRAPVLFGGIAVLWLALALVFLALLYALARRLAPGPSADAAALSESRAMPRRARRSRR